MLLAVDDGASIETLAKNYRIPTTPLWDHALEKTIGTKRGKLGMVSFEKASELVNEILKMQRLSHPINLNQCCLKVVEIT